ncbi:ASCH domain-containing protein [Aeromonas schubertii]|uniref:ASCH domain-containing protein n=1 Tax=Aeromonas schubertii TaxID=652 RepID=UPI0010A91B81|nr:ASCH domain-containing protein [Aeromonas schubertii]QCG47934.1 ASCH domain-containing protein [Aeromonas schubertii]
MDKTQQQFLERYLATLGETERARVPQWGAEHFCADEFNANECARLIARGVKQASCSLLAGYEMECEPLPLVGRLTVVLNWAQEPVCIIRLTEVTLCPFNEVTPEFAALEGEGDLSHAGWKAAHLRFFSHYANTIGAEFNEHSLLVLERFTKVFPL